MKPDNFMLSYHKPITDPLTQNDDFSTIIVDFGLAKPEDKSFSIQGNLTYKSPELIEEIKNGSKSNKKNLEVFSIGAIITDMVLFKINIFEERPSYVNFGE